MSFITSSPIECYTEHPLSAYGELGEVFQAIGEDRNTYIRAGTGFLIYGPPGNGKSSVVGALHKVLADQKVMVHWVDCAQWPTTFFDRSELVEDLISQNCHILVLDDLGREQPFCNKDLERVIMARSKLKNRLDFMTCNLNVDVNDAEECELTTTYGQAARSRLFGMCRRNIINFNGPDHRLALG